MFVSVMIKAIVIALPRSKVLFENGNIKRSASQYAIPITQYYFKLQ